MYTALSDLHGFMVADIPSRKVIERVLLPPVSKGMEPLVPHTPTHGLGLTRTIGFWSSPALWATTWACLLSLATVSWALWRPATLPTGWRSATMVRSAT